MDAFAPLRERFVRGLGARFQNMWDCLARQDRRGLELEVHKLRGGAGVFGFQPLSDTAGKVEDELLGETPLDGEHMRAMILQLQDQADELCAAWRQGEQP